MHQINADIHISKRNSTIGYATQNDNVTLTLRILSEIDWVNPTFELIAIKSDDKRVYEKEQDAFNVDIENKTIQIRLKEQFLTTVGILKLQLIISDSGRISTSIFNMVIGESLEGHIIESIDDVITLKNLEDYIVSGYRDLAIQEQRLEVIEKLTTNLNETITADEADRQANELNRTSKELIRIDNEEDRVANEEVRVANEEVRVANEEERVQNEHDRVTNETNRRLAENTRITQERARQDAELQRNSIFEENENLRKNGEKTRIANENERKKKFESWEGRETTRLKSEENRIVQEQERIANEEERQQQEQIRQNQEDYRQRTYNQFNEAETDRINKEAQRQSAEENRVAAEINRQNTYIGRENERDRQYAESEKTRNDAFEQNEVNRQSEYTTAERQRVESEELRKSRERERETAESQRATTERERVNAEQKRAADFKREIENIQNTMNQAVSNVNGAIDTANSTMEGIEQRAEECLPVIEQSSNEIERARVDYIGNQHSSIKKANDANVDWLLGEVNTAHYEGQHITALDTLEGRAKSAILKGQTLVNLVPKKIIDHIASSDWDGYCCLVQNSKQSFGQWRALQDLKPNTKYYISCYVETFEDANNKDYCLNNPSVESIFEDSMIINGVGRYQWLSTTKSELTDEIFIVLRSQNAHARGAIKIRDIMIIEYQEGMENWDIPYFEGMQSVKMPVLTTIGKNLWNNYQLERGSISHINGINLNQYTAQTRSKGYIPIVPNTKYIATPYGFDGTTSSDLIRYYDSEKNFIGTSPNEKSTFLRTVFQIDIDNISHIQLEPGTVATPFEPYKSNILTVNEDVELRGIGDVKDELNVSTGEVTERIGEYIITGEEPNLVLNTMGAYPMIEIILKGIKGDCRIMGNKIHESLSPIYSSNTVLGVDVVGNVIRIRTQEILDGQSLDEFKKTMLPLTIKYELAQEVIKTVDLSDNHVYSYKGTTHYDCSSAEGSLVPTLSIDVPTNLPALVSRQRATIESQKEQIITLEQENEQLIAQNEVQDIDIVTNLLANTELFEMFLLSTPMNLSDNVKSVEVSPMVEVYVTLILKGKKTIDDVPAIIRQQVQEQLDVLTK